MELVKTLIDERRLSGRRACRAVGVSRTRLYYQPAERDDSELIAAILVLIEEEPGWGQDKVIGRLVADGRGWNPKRIRRVYRALKLHLRRRGKRRLPARVKEPLALPVTLNECWSADFMSDALYSGRRFRTFNVIDDFAREGLDIEIDTSITGERVVRVLERIRLERGCAPKRLRLDNGPEMISDALQAWADEQGVRLQFIQPGRPMQNGFIERFNRSFRNEVLDAYLFETLQDVRAITRDWLWRYNHRRTHDSLDRKTPAEYARSAAWRGTGEKPGESGTQTSLL
jgi:putative transposase